MLEWAHDATRGSQAGDLLELYCGAPACSASHALPSWRALFETEAGDITHKIVAAFLQYVQLMLEWYVGNLEDSLFCLLQAMGTSPLRWLRTSGVRCAGFLIAISCLLLFCSSKAASLLACHHLWYMSVDYK